MTPREQNIETVQSFLVGVERGDLEKVLSGLDEDARWIGPAEGRSSREIQGKQQIAAMLRHLGTGELHLRDTTLHADGDHVFAEFTRTLGETKEHNLAVFELAFGKVREIREFTLKA